MNEKEYIQMIQLEIERINCPELKFYPEQERVGILLAPDRTAWPHPIGLRELSQVLLHIPDNSSVEAVSERLSMYSLGWHSGRERMLENDLIRETYYKEQGIGPKPELETSSPPSSPESEPPSLSSMMDTPPDAPGPDDLIPSDWQL